MRYVTPPGGSATDGPSELVDWEAEATRWIAWARTPGHDSYWYYRDAFFGDIVPEAGARTLDLACGEGRVARDLTAGGHHVIGVDVSPTLIGAARDSDANGRYLLSDAERLPFADRAFDLVVAYNCLMDVDDMPATVREVARVLRPGGRLAASITHPTTLAGAFADRQPDARFVITGSYLGPPRATEFRAERDGLTMTFRDRAYPLEAWVSALEEAGLLIERIREPAASDASLARFGPSDLRWRRLPMFLHLRAIKAQSSETS